MENKICVYAICKNEIKALNKWLASMSEADYIVVLDTGSTDGTYEKLQKDHRVYKVKQKIYEPFRFENARNDSMKLVPKDANILVCIDIDELFNPGWADEIRDKWTEAPYTRGHYKYAWSHDASGEPTDIFINDKIHTRDYYWKYPVHEVLEPNDESQNETVIEFENILLEHFPDPLRSGERYFDMVKLRAEEYPDDVYSRYLLAREYGLAGDYQTALDEFNKTLSLPNIQDDRLCYLGSLLLRSDILFTLGYPFDAIQGYNFILTFEKTYREVYVGLANAYLSVGAFSTAIGLIQDGFRLSKRHYDWVEQAPTWGSKPYDILSVAYTHLEEFVKAYENVQIALKYDPNDDRIQKNFEVMKENYEEQINN